MAPRSPTTLPDLIRAFMEYAEDEGQPTFPALDSRLWHELFYALQMSLGDKAPLLGIGPFTGNGEYPKNKKLSEAMKEAAHACSSNFNTGRITVAVPLAENNVQRNWPGLIEAIYAAATELEGFFENS